jgi:hypothetical protein
MDGATNKVEMNSLTIELIIIFILINDDAIFESNIANSYVTTRLRITY